MYYPFLWRITKGQLLIIKRRWWRWLSNARQICSQGLKLGKHVHQKLTMSHWTVMTVSKSRQMLETSEAKGGGAVVAVGSTNASVAESPIEGGRGGGGGATPEEEESTLGRLELARIWAALCLRKVAPIGAIICTGSEAGKDSNPKCSKILWIKTGKKRAWAKKLLRWTSTKERMKRWGKLIGASVTSTYKNAHLSIGIVCK